MGVPATGVRAGSTPDFLAIGHVTKDIQADGYTLGGTVTYAGLLAARLGLRTAIVTACGPDLQLSAALEGITASVRVGPESTTFRNSYTGSQRQQLLLSIAEPISLTDVPPEWRSTGITLLGPVAGELRADLFTAFGNSLVALTPQGLMRAWDDEGKVHAIRWADAEALLPGVDLLVLSEEDLPAPGELERFTRLVEVVAVTHSEQGATVYEHGRPSHFPAFPSAAAEPTGAGDVFAAAFCIELDRTGSIARAATFANCAASFVIEAPGATGLPTRERIEERIATQAQSAADG